MPRRQIHSDKTPSWNFDEQNTLTGVLLEVLPNSGQYNKTCYKIQTDDGETYKAWGVTVLDDLMSHAKLGEKVEIKYLGLTQGKNAPYKDYELTIIDPDAPASDLNT